MKTLILSDGIPGHFNQSRGVASLLQEDIDLNVHLIKNVPATFIISCLLYTSPSPRDATLSRMPSSA